LRPARRPWRPPVDFDEMFVGACGVFVLACIAAAIFFTSHVCVAR